MSDSMWANFAKRLVMAALMTSFVLYALVLLVDPYDNVPFSLPLERAPITQNQRYSYPALARKTGFDSLVVGTSSIRLLRPDRLNQLLGARFVNLAMNSGTPYEQLQIASLFVRHHPSPRFVIIGVDQGTYCHNGEVARFTKRPFPPWMYDENPWNDLLYLFNFSALEEGIRQLEFQMGVREPKYGFDGYKNFLPPQSAYDQDKVRKTLYGNTKPTVHPPRTPSARISVKERDSWPMAGLEPLRELLRKLPSETRAVLLFPPYHQTILPTPGTRRAARLDECKRRVAALAEPAGALVLDMMFRSAITLDDGHYWDAGHYTVPVADRLMPAIARAVRSGGSDVDFMRDLQAGG